MIILLHSSKTMRPSNNEISEYRQPVLLDDTLKLQDYLKTRTIDELMEMMKVSGRHATSIHSRIQGFSTDSNQQRAAIDSFLGDIYSGLQAVEFNETDRRYADKHLRIISGLYGILRALDGIYPYRLEMGYKLPGYPEANLYQFWGDKIASTIPKAGPVVNLLSVEYSKGVAPYVEPSRIVTPVFKTISPKTGEPSAVAIHSKIARGAFANWLIKTKAIDTQTLPDFTDIGYHFDESLSTPQTPVFTCKTFGGKGLSLRLTP
jgi:cytoplasmic iron level regulating protein YaaA (DUF328/UPF0246 family)